MSETLPQALIELQSQLPDITKGRTAKVETKGGGSYSYDYADLVDITDAMMPLLAKCGLAFVCTPTVNDAGAFVLGYQLVHQSGESIDGQYPLPTGGTPQVVGSAITYARRYVLCAITGVVAAADDDGRVAQYAADNRPAPVDLSALDAAIVTAQDVGVDKDWSVTRKYAEQSQAHADKAASKVRDLIAEAQAGAE